MSNTFIAGKDSTQYDFSDWAIDDIPVYLNPINIPVTSNVEDIENMTIECCRSWSLRFKRNLVFFGLTKLKVVMGAIVVNYGSAIDLKKIFDGEVNGLCRYYTSVNANNKNTLEAAEIYINRDYRPNADRFTQAVIMHELGHACEIHGHTNKYGNVMNVSSMGNFKLTLEDCQMLNNWNPYTAELHADKSITIPAVSMPDGSVQWVELEYNDYNSLLRSWSIDESIKWEGPLLDNVMLGESFVFHDADAVRVHFKEVSGRDFSGRVDFALVNNTLFLEYAE